MFAGTEMKIPERRNIHCIVGCATFDKFAGKILLFAGTQIN
jgi:hypothetical protein